MNWNTVALAQVRTVPWRNGGGVTRELLAWPSAADWRLRLSVADVERDGPFSRFDGIERWFAVLEGEGVVLQLQGEEIALTPASPPLRFAGEADVHCRLLGGATRDFNLMAPPGRATLRRLAGRHALQVASGRLVALYAHRAAVELQGGDGFVLPPATLAWRRVDQPLKIELAAPDCLWMESAS